MGNVYGHYVLANGVGSITACENVGAPVGGDSFALSLIAGSWSVNATNGDIYVQEVRNPNGVFNHTGHDGSVAAHLFDYAPQAAVSLNAGNGVYLTDAGLPRLPGDAVQVIYPPILNLTAGACGVTLQDNLTLFPSAYQSLNLTTTDGGGLVSVPNTPGTTPELLMSDSSRNRWVAGQATFSDGDHGPLSAEPTASTTPVTLEIAGNMENLTLITTKETQINVGGNMINCGFSGQNLNASNVTSIKVAGQIYNQSAYTYVAGVTIPGIPVTDLPSGMSSSWDNIFTLAVNPTVLAGVTVPPGTTGPQLY